MKGYRLFSPLNIFEIAECIIILTYLVCIVNVSEKLNLNELRTCFFLKIENAISPSLEF